MKYEDLGNSLIYFIDTWDTEEEKESVREHIRAGFSNVVEKRLSYLDNFIASNPDKKELGWFIATEMNRDFDDPTGEQHFQWLVGARDLIQSVLEENNAHQEQP